MAIKIIGSTIIDDSRNIVNAGIVTVTSVSIGNTQVVSSERQLQNIASLDATTTATIEAAIQNAPNTFTDLLVTGIATVNSNLVVNGNTLYADATNNRVGIGTTNPQRSLHIVGVGSTSGIRLGNLDFFAFASDTNNSGSPTFRNSVLNGNTVLRVIPNGSGDSQFEFFGNDYYSNTSSWDNVRIVSSATEFRIDSAYATGGTAKPIRLETNVSDGGTIFNNPYQLFLATNGNVGIATSTPTSKLTVQGDVSVSGVVTATTFIGQVNAGVGTITTLSGTTATYTTLNGTTGNINTGIITTLSGTNLNYSGIATIGTLGVSGVTTTQHLSVTGVSTFTNGPVFIGAGSSTGTASQRLQVTGGAYVSGSVGIGTTNPVTPLHISDGNGAVSSALYTSDLVTISAQNSAPGFNIIAASSASSSSISHRGVFKATRARGTLSSPTVPFINDYTFSLLGAIYDGSTNRATAAVNMEVDGDVGVGTAPQRITFWTGTGSSRVERVRITGIGSVGIGTTNPATRLDVFGGNVRVTGTTNPSFIVTPTSGSSYIFGANTLITGGGIYDNTAGVWRLVVKDTTGNIGIGTTNPAATLNVVPTSTSIAGLFSGTTSSDMVRITQLGSGNALVVEDSANPDATPFVVNASGSVGIGTINPTSKLHVTSTDPEVILVDRSSNNNSLIQYRNTSGSMYAGLSNNATGWGVDSDNNLATSPHLLVLKGGGEVLIGTTTSTGTASQPLQVTGGAYVSGNVGIGTTNPQSTLQVKDALAFETTNTTTTSTSQVAVDTFATATFRSAKYQVQVTCPGQISTLGGITTGGRGYTAGTFNVTFTTSSGNGSAAQGTLTISNGTVGQIGLGTTGGSGYTAGDVLTASGGSGLQVSVATTASPSGRILTLGSITSAGIGYTAGVGVGTTTLTFLGGTGSGAVGLATIFDGVITSSTLLQQPTTGTGGTVFYSGSNYSTASVLTIATSGVTNTITTITGSVGVSTFTSLTAHGIRVSDTIRVSSTSNGLTAGTNYFVVSVPSSTTFTLGASVGVGTTFTTGSSLSIGFFRNSANAGGQVAYTNAITGVSTNFQVSDLLVLQSGGSTTDYVEYATIANNDVLGTFATDISGANARLLFTPTYPNNNVKVARQAITV